jgi:hypothetical protein
MRVDLEDERQACAFALLLGVLDYGRSVLCLNAAKAYTAIPLVTRAALDAYVDLVNICDHKDYWEYLEAADTFEWKKVLQNASSGRNSMLEALRMDPIFEIGRRLQTQRLAELESRGITKLEIGERFERAGLKDIYDSVYQMLSAESHNNTSQLRSRYLILRDERLHVRAREGEPPGHNYEDACTLTMGEIVLKSTEKLLRWRGHGLAVVSEADAELTRLQSLAQELERKAN